MVNELKHWIGQPGLRGLGLLSRQLARSSSAIVLSLLFLTGCNMNDPMIQEMDSAYAVKESNEDVTRVVQKYFPPGMKVEDAFKLLRQLKEQGFEIDEYQYEGARRWPDGELKPYLDEVTKRNLQRYYLKGEVTYTVSKKYDSKFLIVTKTAGITLRTDGERILESSGGISISGI